MPPLLEARNIRKVYHGGGQLLGGEVSETVACNDFSLSIDADNPTFTTIAGESGSGKTTIARMLLGLLEPSSVEVLYQGQDARDLKKDGQQRFRQDVQAIFQDPFEVYNADSEIWPGRVEEGSLRKNSGSAAHRRAQAGRDTGSLSAPVVGRPAPTHHDRPRAIAQAQVDYRR